jgi:16S rRNA (guanine1516-N2)-methyltransferase
MNEPGLMLYHQQDFVERAQIYAPWCQLQAASKAPVVTAPALYLDREGMWLCMPGYPNPFQPSHTELLRRAQSSGTRTELARACGSALTDLHILDACAGFGSDGLLLAQLGAKVCMVERQRLVWILLQERVRHFAGAQAICDEAAEVLARPSADVAAAPWDVILLDPMFPPRGKKALPNRGLQHLRELTESAVHGDDGLILLRLALEKTAGRVVVKRRLKDAQLLSADFQIKGKSIRFDIYRGQMPAS